MKKLQNIGKKVVLFAVPVIVLYTLVNIYLVTKSHSGRSEPLFLVNKKVNHKAIGLSSRVQTEPPPARFSDDNNAVTTPGMEAEIEELVAKMEKEDQTSPKEEEVKLVTDTVAMMQNNYVDRMIEKIKLANNGTFFPSYFWNEDIHDLTRRFGGIARKDAKTLSGYNKIKLPGGKIPAWKLFHRNVRQFSLYEPDDPSLYNMLVDMATLPIIEADENTSGTQLKMTVRFSNEGRAILKPMRYPREVEADENRYIFDDMERHVAEIAAFQLDKLLGFYRVPPTIGRLMNITSELKPIMPKSIRDTLFTSPVGNLCFYGKCEYFCDSAHAFCGHPDMIEVSLQSYLPSRNIATRKEWYQPWARSYSSWEKAYWEKNDDLCDSVRTQSPFNNGKLLMDMIDAHTFDFLTGNKDRHSFTTFTEFGNYSFPIMFDNGRGFGRQTYDAMSILAPLRQCCMIRKSTLIKYIKLYLGPVKLSVLMEMALETDPIAPVLIRPHLDALDRRLIKILQAVAECIEKFPVKRVVVNDKF